MGASLLKNITYGTYVGEPKKGETGILRNPNVVNSKLRETMHLGCETVWDSFEINLKKNRHKRNFIGYRKKIKKDELEKKFSWITYEEANELILNFSRGLNVLNLCPKIDFEDDNSFRFLGIYSRNKKEWLLSYLGAMRDSITIVTIYDTLGDRAIEFILEQSQVTSLLVEIKALKKIYELAQKDKTFKVKNLIIIEKEDDEETAKNLESLGFNIFTWEEVVEKGKEEGQNLTLKKPKADDITIINYTSGTTGLPKGVKVSHRNIVVNTDVIEVIGLYPTTNDVYLSYLPYAHIMETLIITVVLNHGVQVGIYNGNAANLEEDFKLLRPTAICAVPRIFQRIYDGINAKLKQKPYVIRKLFDKAIKIKIKDYIETGILKNILFDNIIFDQVRSSFGGRLRFMLVGSAPVEPYLLNFLRCSLSCEIVEGYGQTEDMAGVLLTRTFDPITQHLGGPGFSCEVKLVDVPELGYTSETIDKDSGKKRPSGELCVRGPIICKGYFRDKEKTSEAIDEDGWLHSGDIAMLIPEHGNALRIVDRVKNIFKLQQGEYISPEKIENIFQGCKYIEQIFIYGDSLQSYLIAVIYPKSHDVVEFLKNKNENVTKENYKSYFDSQDLKTDIIKELDKYGRSNGLKGFELPKKIHLTKEHFTVENQIITPTMKIRRHIAKKYFEKEIKQLYGI